ncbi:hypothetical protein EDB85DRAFT_1304031 [Lactarius pseudohatsudake]|nr:hypothetical protein EDB85DRAFT_1304031 [Lactarius pseudohatsudake]
MRPGCGPVNLLGYTRRPVSGKSGAHQKVHEAQRQRQVRCKDASGSGPEITHFRYFQSRSGVTWLSCHSGLAFSRRRPPIVPHRRHSLLPPSSYTHTHTHTHTLSLSLSLPLLPLLPSSRRHGPPSTTTSQDAPQPLVRRPRVPAPRAAFVLQLPVPVPVASPSLLSLSRCQDHSSPALQDTVGDRAGHRAVVGGLLSCVMMSRPPLSNISVCSLPFT